MFSFPIKYILHAVCIFKLKEDLYIYIYEVICLLLAWKFQFVISISEKFLILYQLYMSIYM